MALFYWLAQKQKKLMSKGSEKILDEELKSLQNLTMWPTAKVKRKLKGRLKKQKVVSYEKVEENPSSLIMRKEM
ncbi:hypothetical protein [Thalassotalea agarivorans]|uniref:Uncharacterized protein n=1 Tax=Thalassotalea agarivorans TaxID=349064 RepID=A0A1H9ZWZ6_THASX|nr:hypothetical protein [Thalassotalea agarivorans]SES86332.1 hypothetical protein SAMN05660429_00619 [Thalassotalea agarivorans]